MCPPHNIKSRFYCTKKTQSKIHAHGSAFCLSDCQYGHSFTYVIHQSNQRSVMRSMEAVPYRLNCISENRNKWPVCEEELTHDINSVSEEIKLLHIKSYTVVPVCVVKTWLTHCIDCIHTKCKLKKAKDNRVPMHVDHIKSQKVLRLPIRKFKESLMRP